MYLFIGNLNAHIMRVHNIPEGEPIYKCNYCSCVFKKVGSLNSHMKRMHTDINEVNIIIYKLSGTSCLISFYFILLKYIIKYMKFLGKCERCCC